MIKEVLTLLEKRVKYNNLNAPIKWIIDFFRSEDVDNLYIRSSDGLGQCGNFAVGLLDFMGEGQIWVINAIYFDEVEQVHYFLEYQGKFYDVNNSKGYSTIKNFMKDSSYTEKNGYKQISYEKIKRKDMDLLNENRASLFLSTFMSYLRFYEPRT